MKKYRVYTIDGYTEFSEANIASAIELNGGIDGIETIEYVMPSENISKRELYQQNCDAITLEIYRRKLLNILTIEEEQELLQQLKEETDKIMCL